MIVQLLVNIFTVYVIIGVLFALLFVSFGVSRIDPAARGTGVGFRLLILPAAAALWPLLAWRWLRGTTPGERNAHRDAARKGKG